MVLVIIKQFLQDILLLLAGSLVFLIDSFWMKCWNIQLLAEKQKELSITVYKEGDETVVQMCQKFPA